ncbi:hypothetical protein PIB30_062472 [Stylosanthes scabra]|uniref:Uncharacterized protein n=1 Tax=Stylosanthes scabra TaxID=79078 RepID=A0ABU6YMC8_9FABA|nr:hypothetical protein [Stylosanthes scabra]
MKGSNGKTNVIAWIVWALECYLNKKNDATGMGMMLDQNSSSSCPFPSGFGPCKEGAHIHIELTDKENRGSAREGTEENRTGEHGDSPATKETKDASKGAGMKEDEDIEEDKQTLQLYQIGGMGFDEDEKVVLATLKKKRTNKDKDQHNKSKGNRLTAKIVGLKFSKRLIR